MNGLDLNIYVAEFEGIIRWDTFEKTQRKDDMSNMIKKVHAACLDQPINSVLTSCITSSELRHRQVGMCISGILNYDSSNSTILIEVAISIDPKYWFPYWCMGFIIESHKINFYENHVDNTIESYEINVDYYDKAFDNLKHAFTLNPNNVNICIHMSQVMGEYAFGIPGISVDIATKHDGFLPYYFTCYIEREEAKRKRNEEYNDEDEEYDEEDENIDDIGEYEVLLHANKIDPTNTFVYILLHNYAMSQSATYVVLKDGRQMGLVDLCVAVIDLDRTNINAWCLLWCHLVNRSDGWIPPNIPARSLADVGLHALSVRCKDSKNILCTQQYSIAQYMYRQMDLTPHTSTWSTRSYVSLWRHYEHPFDYYISGNTERLFETLLMGIQRLESTGILEKTHYSMIEDMLECWTWHDHCKGK